MSIDWRRLCVDLKFALDGDDIVIEFDNQRTHRVRIVERDDVLECHAVVARQKTVSGIDDLAMRVWQHNRASQRVSFRVDDRGGVKAIGWMPKLGLSANEFQRCIRRVAIESDRLEFLLTGKDNH